MIAYFNNISLRIRLTVLTMTFVVGLSGALLLLMNNNAAIQIASVAVPLTKVYVADARNGEALPAMASSEAATSVMPQTALVASEKSASAEVPVEAGAKVEKASFILSTAAQDIRQYSYIAFAALVLLSGILVYYWCGRLLRPVQQLATEMQKRTVNTLNQPIENENAAAEIKQLSTAFNHMILNLNHSFEMQKQFNANAAHELRTPIAILQVNMESLEEEANPNIDEYKAFMEISKRTVSRMNQLVESLLQMTQLPQSLKTDTIDISSLLQRAIADARLIAFEREIAIEYNAPSHTCCIKGNETLLFTAVYNLIENAVKYNRKKGSVYVQLSVESDFVHITVSDTGIGIIPAELAAIFQPFYRVDKSRARGLGGAGMGLSLVKEIIEFHNGLVSAESDFGVGSRFLIDLPILV